MLRMLLEFPPVRSDLVRSTQDRTEDQRSTCHLPETKSLFGMS
jgi:hypothetical protein